MDEWQPKCKYDIGETCCASISVDQLQELSEDKTTNILQPGKKLDYGEIRGSKELRSNLAKLYSSKVGTVGYSFRPGAVAHSSLRKPTASGQHFDHPRRNSRKSPCILLTRRSW
jgi:hypothetical protein